VETLFPRTARRRGSGLLEVEGFGPASATFTLHRGEILGIAGLLGAGRTSLLRGLFGLEPVRAGRVRLGAWSGRHPPHERWNQGMGMVSEDRKGEGLALGLGVADNLTLSSLGGFGPRGIVLPARQDSVAAAWIERLGIRASGPRQRVADLSGGNQQKVALARLLHHGVDVLLLDEPTRGIDVASKAQVYALVDAVVGEGKAAILVSSYLPELLGMCDRIAVMHRGQLGPARPVEEWSEHSLMMAATGAGEAA
jgi:ribose transport system ATP-binding protein